MDKQTLDGLFLREILPHATSVTYHQSFYEGGCISHTEIEANLAAIKAAKSVDEAWELNRKINNY
jgi:hypothetical protein